MRSFSVLIQANGTTIVMMVPTRIAAVASSRNRTGFFSHMITLLLGYAGSATASPFFTVCTRL